MKKFAIMVLCTFATLAFSVHAEEALTEWKQFQVAHKANDVVAVQAIYDAAKVGAETNQPHKSLYHSIRIMYDIGRHESKYDRATPSVEWVKGIKASCPDDISDRAVVALVADIQLRNKDYGGAIETLQDSDRPGKYGKLAVCYTRLGDFTKGYEYAIKSLIENPEKKPKKFTGTIARVLKRGIKGSVPNETIVSDFKKIAAMYPPDGAKYDDPDWIKALQLLKYRIETLEGAQ